MSGADEGKRGVMREAVRAAATEHQANAAAAAGNQVELFPAPTRHTGRRADALQLALRDRAGAGRPPGSGNLATKEFREFLLARGVSPLVQIMRWSMHTPTSLAAELGCTRLEAFDRLKDLWGELAPYLHQRMPQAVEVDQRSAGMLILGAITADQAREIGRRWGVSDLQLVAQEVQQNQAVSSAGDEKSQAAQSQEDGK
jgi:hypothetical protein